MRVQSPKCVAINLEGRTSATYSRHSRWARGLFEPMGSTKRPVTLWMFVIYIYILIGKLVYLVYTPGSKKRSQLPLKVVLVRGYARPHSKIASIQLGESLWSINISCVYMYTYTHTRTYILYMYIFDISILWKFYYLVSSNHCHHLSFGMQSKASYD